MYKAVKEKPEKSIRREKNLRGSITVFAALTFMLVAQLIFVLAEGCRQVEMGKVAEMNTDSVAESLMAEYCVPMWEEYHLLANDVGGSGTSVDEEYMKNYLLTLTLADFAVDTSLLGFSQGNLLRTTMKEVSFDSYTLLTDQQGAAFTKLVAAYMKQNLVYESAQKVYNNYEAIENVENNSSYGNGLLTNCLNMLIGSSKNTSSSHAKTSELLAGAQYGKTVTVRTTPAPTSSSGSETVSYTPAQKAYAEKSQGMLKDVAEVQAKGVLSVVVPSDKTVSSKSLDQSTCVSHRALASGVNPDCESASWYDEMLLQQYAMNYFSCFTEKRGTQKDTDSSQMESPLSYELEYLVSGKDTDEENLKAAAEKLMVIREAANMLYLMSDVEKQAAAEEMAAGISLVLLSPEAVEVVKTAILAAWAFCESVMDIRALLNGKKISLLKTSETWTSSLLHLSDLLSGNAESRNCEGGLDYQSYLGVLLLKNSVGKTAMRCMDLQEKTVQTKSGYADFQMDHCLTAIAFTAEYSYEPMFYSFVYLIHSGSEESTISRQGAYSYLKNKNGG